MSSPGDDPTSKSPTSSDTTTTTSTQAKEKRRSLLPTLKTSPRSPQDDAAPSAAAAADETSESQRTVDFKTGDRVCLGGVKLGILQYFGETQFAEGDWCGVELDDPDGKHDGTVDGVSYFKCKENHGIFAPEAKVELLKEESNPPNLKTPSPSSETAGSRLRQPRVSGLPQPSPRQQSVSPEPKRKKTSSESDDSDLSPGTSAAKPKSRLAKLKAVPKALDSTRRSENTTPSSSRESSVSRETDSLPGKPSKLPLSGKRSSIPKLGTLKKQPQPVAKDIVKESDASEPAFGETFVIDATLDESDSVDLTDSNPGKKGLLQDQRQDFNTTFVVEDGNGNSDPEESPSEGTLQSSIPDLLTPPGQDLYAKKEPPFETDSIFLEKDAESDFLAHSRASSLGLLTDQDLYNNSLLSSGFGILTEQELCNNSLVGEEARMALLKDKESLQQKDAMDLPEKEIDQEISGISTPEIDVSSGKEAISSPEPDVLRHEFDLSFDLKPGQTSTPVSPAKQLGAAASGGEKMATPVMENGFMANGGKPCAASDLPQMNANETYTVESRADATYTLAEGSADRDIEPMDVDHVHVNQTYKVCVQRRDKPERSCAESSDDSDEYPKRMRTSADLDEVDIDLMSASFELAKTAVAQYADLVKGSEVVRAQIKELNEQSQLNKDANREREQEQSSESESSTSDSVEQDTEPITLDLIGGRQSHDNVLVKEAEEEEEGETDVSSPSHSVQAKDDVQEGESVQIEDVDPKVMIASGHAIDLGQHLIDDEIIPPQTLAEAEGSFVGSVDSLEEAGTDTQVQGHHDFEETDQLIADLQEGHRRTERPTSMISSCSADTGILADVPGSDGDKKERPVSLISTSSVDTGYQPDTDTEIGNTLTANSPLDDDAPSTLYSAAPPPQETEEGAVAPTPPSQGYTSLEEAYTDTFQRFQKAVMKGTIRATTEASGSDSNLSFYSSDGGTVVAESETERDDSDMDESTKPQPLMDRRMEQSIQQQQQKPSEKMEEGESEGESGTDEITVEEIRITSPEEMEGVCELDSPDSLQPNPTDGTDPERPPYSSQGLSGLLQPTDPSIPSIMLQQPSPITPERSFVAESAPGPPVEEEEDPQNATFVVGENNTVTESKDTGGVDLNPSEGDVEAPGAVGIETSAMEVQKSAENGLDLQKSADNGIEAGKSVESAMEEETAVVVESSASASQRFSVDDFAHLQSETTDELNTSCTSELRNVEMELVPRDSQSESASTAASSQPGTETESAPSKTESEPETTTTAPPSEKRTKGTPVSTPEKKVKVEKKIIKTLKSKEDKSKTTTSTKSKLGVKRDTAKDKTTSSRSAPSSRESTPTRTPLAKRKLSAASVSGKKIETAAEKTPARKGIQSVAKASSSTTTKTAGAKSMPDNEKLSSLAGKKSLLEKSQDKPSPPVRRPSKTTTSKLLSYADKKPTTGEASTNLKLKKEATNNGKKKATVSQSQFAIDKKAAISELAGKMENKLELDSSQKSIVVSPAVISNVKAGTETEKQTVKRAAIKRERPKSKLEMASSQSTSKREKEKEKEAKTPARLRSDSRKTAGLAGSRTPSNQSLNSSKPLNRTTQSLRKRERSASVESDSQPSVGKKTVKSKPSSSYTSQVSSQGSRPSTSSLSGRRTKESTPEPAKRFATKRSSVVEGTASPKISAEPRRASVAVTSASRLTTPSRLNKPPASHSASSSPKRAPKDQNRNKTVKSSSTVSHLKRSNQPDLVTNSIGNTHAAQEISRLEALCETRTKELTLAKLELRRQADGFEAMAVLVQYLTQELNAFSCPEISAKLEDSKIQIAKAQEQLVELTKQRDALIDEIQSLKQQHQDEMDRLEADHQGALQTLEQRLNRERDEEIRRVTAEHEQAVLSLRTSHDKQLSRQEDRHSQETEDAAYEFQQRLTKHKRDNEDRLADLQKQHTTQLEEITMRFQGIKLTLSQKVDMLRNECEEMRQREKGYMEACQRDADLKVQMALAPYRHLPQEIESLKHVMELRNQQIHALRLEKSELERQLEELPVARDKIRSLEQKIENLEAIIDIKADYERQLSEKHQVLLRRYDRESKANKRLSMDKEELSWRLSQSDFGSPDVLRRSINHSPTNSECSTPEHSMMMTHTASGVKLRHPKVHSPRSPRDLSKEFDRSPVHSNGTRLSMEQPKTNLRRSGTYELLNQDVDEEEDLKQSDV